MPKLERWIGTLAVVLAVPVAAAAAQDHGHDGRHGQADHATMNSGAVITIEDLTNALALTADQQQAITPHLAAVNRSMKALHDALGDEAVADHQWETASPELRAKHDALKAELSAMEALFTDVQLKQWRQLHHQNHDGDHDGERHRDSGSGG
ncbi:MAG: hypothetical protein V3S19_07900 [Gemmatimonadales bacterium]